MSRYVAGKAALPTKGCCAVLRNRVSQLNRGSPNEGKSLLKVGNQSMASRPAKKKPGDSGGGEIGSVFSAVDGHHSGERV